MYIKTYMHAMTVCIKKEAMSLKESRERYVEGFGGSKGKGYAVIKMQSQN